MFVSCVWLKWGTKKTWLYIKRNNSLLYILLQKISAPKFIVRNRKFRNISNTLDKNNNTKKIGIFNFPMINIVLAN